MQEKLIEADRLVEKNDALAKPDMDRKGKNDMKNIRNLENKLDKAMIKYNEALSISKTYQSIFESLKNERQVYDK
jgi:hypothetical protein